MRTGSKLFVAMLLAFTVWAGGIMGLLMQTRQVPVCQEDVVLVGTGQFEAGRWTSYECGPALDDYRDTR